jgi:hypothetical protein
MSNKPVFSVAAWTGCHIPAAVAVAIVALARLFGCATDQGAGCATKRCANDRAFGIANSPADSATSNGADHGTFLGRGAGSQGGSHKDCRQDLLHFGFLRASHSKSNYGKLLFRQGAG